MLARTLTAVLMLVLLAAAGRNTYVVARLVVKAPRLPQWDMARRGMEGVHLAEALARGDVAELVWRINETSVWPPVFPLVEAPLFLAFGYDYRVPRLLVTLLFFLSVPAIFWAARQLDPRHGTAAGLLAAGFLCASPFFHLFAAQVMLEIPGALLLILCLGAYARALGSASPGRWRAAWCLTTVLFFCKFNYGLMWLVPLLLIEVWRACGTWSAAGVRLGRRLSAIDPKRPWNLFVLLYLAALGAVVSAGGYRAEVAGARLSVTSVGSPLYLLYVLWVLRWAMRPRRSWRRFWRWLGGLEPRLRQLVFWVVIPIAVWMLLPPHARDFFHFVQNRSSEMALVSRASLAYYPRILVDQFSPSRGWGEALLVLAFSPCLLLPRLELRQRTLCLALLCGSAAILVHPYKLPRFAFTVAPLVWLSASLVVARLLHWASRHVAPARLSRPLALLLSGALMAATVAAGVDQRRLLFGYTRRTVPRAVEAVLRDVYLVARGGHDVAVLGTWNLLSPWLIEWHLRQRYPDLDRERIPRSGRQLGEIHPASICTDLTAAEVIVLGPLPSAHGSLAVRGYAAEIAALEPVVAALAGAPCYRLVGEKSHPRSGYRLRLYRRRDT